MLPAVALLASLAPMQLVDVASVLTPAHDLLAKEGGRGLDFFYPLGFTKDGAFASVTVGCGDESGSVCYSAVLVDLATDRVVERIDATDDYGPLTLAAFGAHVQALVDRHQVRAPLTQAVPTFVAEQRFTVRLATNPPANTMDANGDSVPRTTVVSLVRDGKPKRIGAVQESGILDTAAPRAIAVLLSPYERRVAVIVVDTVYGGCVGGRELVHVIGAHLDERY